MLINYKYKTRLPWKLPMLFILFLSFCLLQAQVTVQNTCPATSVDLTLALSADNLPADTELTFHTTMPATDANQIADATAVGSGTYYAAFYDAVGMCYSPTQEFNVVISPCGPIEVQNTCPETTVDLTMALSTDNMPANTELTFHTATPATDANQIADATSVGAGTYYAAFYDAVGMCYSPTQMFDVQIVACDITISGNVFYDTDKLTNGTVDGTHITPTPTLYAALVNSAGTVIDYVELAPRRAAGEGTFEFTNVPGGVEYRVILRADEPVLGDALTNASLPLSYSHTGENIGSGVGSDGMIDGISASFIPTSDVTEVNFGVIYFRPSTTP